jgi:hypothetical protein
VPVFLTAQLAGAMSAAMVFGWLLTPGRCADPRFTAAEAVAADNSRAAEAAAAGNIPAAGHNDIRAGVHIPARPH